MGGDFITKPIIEVQNVVASGAFDQKIDLLHIAASLDRAEYNPESFPGLVLRVSDPKAVFLLFSTGKLVCTGGKSKEDGVVVKSDGTIKDHAQTTTGGCGCYSLA